MSNVIIYDKTTKRIKNFLKSVHTPDYANRDDVLINPPTLPTCERKYWIVYKSSVKEMGQAEKEIVDAEEQKALKQARLNSAQDSAQALQTDIQYLKDNFTNQEIIELAKKGDLTARILVLKVLYSQADTTAKKFKVLAKFNRLVDWED